MRVNGPKGELSERIQRDITVAQDGEELSSRARPTAASTAPCTG